MGKLLIMGIIGLVAILGAVTYLGAAGTAIMYALGANDSPKKRRRLTPLECERLDGFPDEWTRYGASGKEMSDNARYMALGNSIAVPCAERVFIGIKKAESEE